jgi:hypothetical protein
MSQLGVTSACLEASLLTKRGLLFDQQAKPFGMIEGTALGIGHHVLEALGHSVQAELTQAIQCRVVQQGFCPQWK